MAVSFKTKAGRKRKRWFWQRFDAQGRLIEERELPSNPDKPGPGDKEERALMSRLSDTEYWDIEVRRQ